jgi:hypothetical protein
LLYSGLRHPFLKLNVCTLLRFGQDLMLFQSLFLSAVIEQLLATGANIWVSRAANLHFPATALANLK